MILLLVSVLYCSILSHSFESSSKDYKHLDGKIAKVIMRPTKEKWDTMLEAMEYYVNKLRDPGLILAQDCEKNKSIITGILKDGCPNFVNLAVDEKYLLNEIDLTKKQLSRFYELRDNTKRTWSEFVTICAKQNVTMHV
uniref:Uncharacterized protein n=1 Tax=Graphocephala atropunctata TaxID=36148 RepID=A0A1B6LSW0_9HEMI